MLTGAVVFLAAASGAIPHPRGYVCPRAVTPPKIDGRLDDAAWKRAPWTDYFVDIEGSAKATPRFRTRAKMLWDDRYFYVAAELEEPHPWATLTAHDSVIFRDHDFEVFIDPDSDGHNYFEFEVNALNTSWDLFLPKPYKGGGSADNSWDIPGLKTAVHVNGVLNDARKRSRGWTVEIAFPWEGFAHAGYRASRPRLGEQWRANFSRVEWRMNDRLEKIPETKEDNWVWSAQGQIDMHLPAYWGYVQFEESAGAAFRKDPNWQARVEVQRVFEAQLVFRKAHDGRWAGSLEELGLKDSLVVLEMTADGWRARLGPVSIVQDARVTVR